MSVMGEDVPRIIKENLDLIGYFHFADAPGRHEVGSGQIAIHEILSLLKDSDYQGTIGWECSPSNDSATALRKIKDLHQLFL
jgi:hydroxypyruvate isomerase